MQTKLREKQISSDGTVKFLSVLEDGSLIETVLMRHPYGSSVCVTSQAGCNMGCRFCASGLLKKERDLTAEEMLAQVAMAEEYVQNERPDGEEDHPQTEDPKPVTHVVVMGTGEPFDNYEEVIRFCDLLSERGIAPRHITVSTCGIVPKIYEFAGTPKRYNLAVSLHAPDNKIRDRLMPVNRKYPVEELVKAAVLYSRMTGRRVTFEYLLLEDINDRAEDAEKLAKLLLGAEETAAENDSGQTAAAWTPEKYFYVNLIPFNPVDEFEYRGISKEKALRFYDILMKHGIKATLRKERGTDISAACGQLRSKKDSAK